MIARLLTQKQAAAYCGMSVPTFKRFCREKPIRFSSRILRFDRVDLDRWLDSVKPSQVPDEERSASEWLSEFDKPSVAASRNV